MSGLKQSKFARGEFVAWDGEGIGNGRRHQYVLLGNSRGLALVDRKGLSTRVVLDALVEGFARAPRAIHVGFAISYDVNMLLRDLPKAKLQALWDAETVDWRSAGRTYRIQYRPRKFFRVTRIHASGARTGGTWWDAWPFFQSSFVSALERYGVASESYRAAMRTMKAGRATFRARDLEQIQAYNADECRSLVTLMERLHASLDAAQLTIHRWDGPGAIAASLLKGHGFKAAIAAPIPAGAGRAFQHAYYGGRIECLRYGHHAGMVHHYDINSAYPAAMRTLPCRGDGCGAWRYIASAKIGDSSCFAVYRVRWHFSVATLHPLPWRSAKGSVYFPSHGDGWAWWPEVRAAVDHAPGHVKIIGRWEWVPRCRHPRPLAWIDEAYAAREAAKARGDGAEHAIKLGLNSLYGKLAQRVGARFDGGRWVLPPFHDLAGAGWITSSVRAQLYRVAMQHPRAVIMLATDGLFSTVPHDVPQTPGQKKLGEWSYETHHSATVVQSGVYILGRADHEEGARIYSRGFAVESIDRAKILAGWRQGQVSTRAYHQRFIGLGAALQFERRFTLWRTWHRERRELTLHPWGTKRTPLVGTRGRPADPSRGLVGTRPTDTRRFWSDAIGAWGPMSAPSLLPWIDGDNEMDAFQRADAESEDAVL